MAYLYEDISFRPCEPASQATLKVSFITTSSTRLKESSVLKVSHHTPPIFKESRAKERSRAVRNERPRSERARADGVPIIGFLWRFLSHKKDYRMTAATRARNERQRRS